MLRGKREAKFPGKPKKPIALIWEIEFTFNNSFHLWVNKIDSRMVSMDFATTRLALFNYWSFFKHMVNMGTKMIVR